MKKERSIFINEIAVFGIKAIDKALTFRFASVGTEAPAALKRHNVNAIYGANSVGKSSFVTAMALYKQVCLHGWRDSFGSFINEKTGFAEFSITFTVFSKQGATTFKHSMKIAKKNEGFPFSIVFESLERFDQNSKEKNGILFLTENGELLVFEGKKPKNTSEEYKATLNVCSEKSALSLFAFEKAMGQKFGGVKWIFDAYQVPILTQVVLNQEDMKYFFGDDKVLAWYFKQMEPLTGLRILDDNAQQIEIPKGEEDEFRKSLKWKADFIRLFDSELVAIDIEKISEKKETNLWREIMIYKGFHVSADQASTGVKKLLFLADALMQSARGGIAFIDEFDAGINDVAFQKMVRFFAQYGEGQLIFTTHNLEPMAVLKDRAKAIAFITDDGKVRTWTQRGNSSVEKMYRNGMIEGIPFNLEPEDFLQAFLVEK